MDREEVLAGLKVARDAWSLCPPGPVSDCLDGLIQAVTGLATAEDEDTEVFTDG